MKAESTHLGVWWMDGAMEPAGSWGFGPGVGPGREAPCSTALVPLRALLRLTRKTTRLRVGVGPALACDRWERGRGAPREALGLQQVTYGTVPRLVARRLKRWHRGGRDRKGQKAPCAGKATGLGGTSSCLRHVRGSPSRTLGAVCSSPALLTNMLKSCGSRQTAPAAGAARGRGQVSRQQAWAWAPQRPQPSGVLPGVLLEM